MRTNKHRYGHHSWQWCSSILMDETCWTDAIILVASLRLLTQNLDESNYLSWYQPLMNHPESKFSIQGEGYTYQRRWRCPPETLAPNVLSIAASFKLLDKSTALGNLYKLNDFFICCLFISPTLFSPHGSWEKDALVRATWQSCLVATLSKS